jgi:hypothetical protein
MKFFQTNEGRLHTGRIAGFIYVLALVPGCRDFLVLEPLAAGGPYARAYAKLAATGFQLHWESAPAGSQAKAKRAKTKFTCPECGQNAWGKPDSQLIYGACHGVVLMLAEANDEGDRHDWRG